MMSEETERRDYELLNLTRHIVQIKKDFPDKESHKLLETTLRMHQGIIMEEMK